MHPLCGNEIFSWFLEALSKIPSLVAIDKILTMVPCDKCFSTESNRNVLYQDQALDSRFTNMWNENVYKENK